MQLLKPQDANVIRYILESQGANISIYAVESLMNESGHRWILEYNRTSKTWSHSVFAPVKGRFLYKW